MDFFLGGLNWYRGGPAYEMGNEAEGGTVFGRSSGVLQQ